MKIPKLGSIVLTRWLDSDRQTDWTYSKEQPVITECESIGWLTYADDKVINIRPNRTFSKDGDEQHVGDMTIPLCAVTAIKTLV